MSSVVKLFASFGAVTALALSLCCSTNADAEGAPGKAATVASVMLKVEGMTCASCALAIRTALKRLDGVRDARVSVEDKRAVVDYEPAKVTPQKMIEAINKLGYRASVPRASS